MFGMKDNIVDDSDLFKQNNEKRNRHFKLLNEIKEVFNKEE